MTDLNRSCPRCGGAQVVLMLAGRVFVWACQRPACYAPLERVRVRQLESATSD
jgi:hypothetical protein